MRHWRRTSLRWMALLTLRKMAEGGLFDQTGGGFFRYSVDAQWQIPHFEKMLNDNGVLLALYADALALTGEPLFRRVVEATADWALREMQADDGGFHASLAADDPQGREGQFYVWESEALRLSLSPMEWDVCAAHWRLVDPPNFEGRSWHLHVARPAAKLAATLDRPQALVEEFITSARDTVFSAHRALGGRWSHLRPAVHLAGPSGISGRPRLFAPSRIGPACG